jgi:hypothetical protein
MCTGALEAIIKVGAPGIVETEKLAPLGGSGPVENDIFAATNAARSVVASSPAESGNAIPNWIALANFSDPGATYHCAFPKIREIWIARNSNCESFNSIILPCASDSCLARRNAIRVVNTTAIAATAVNTRAQSIAVFHQSAPRLNSPTRAVKDWMSDTSTFDFVALAIIAGCCCGMVIIAIQLGHYPNFGPRRSRFSGPPLSKSNTAPSGLTVEGVSGPS